MKTRLSLILFAVAFIFFGGLIKSLDAELETKHSPNGMNSFQMTGNIEDANMIRSIWREQIIRDGERVGYNRISVASTSYFLDCIFLFAYGGLLYLFVVRSNTSDTHVFTKKFIPFLPLGAMAMDGLENALSLSYLNDLTPWTLIIPIATFFKFAFIVASIVYMKRLLLQISEYSKTIFEVLWVFRIIVISLLVLYLALWQSDQGQDLLINLNSHWVGPVVFFTSITILASVHWHLPKFLSTHTEAYKVPTTVWGWIKVVFWDSITFKNLSKTQIKYVQDSDLARGFGIATFLIPAFGVLNVLDKFKIYNLYPHYFLVACLFLLGIALNYNWLDNAYKVKRNRWVFHLLLLLFFITFILLHFFNLWWPNLIWLFIGLVLLAFAFLIVVSIRREFPIAWLQGVRLAPLIMGGAAALALMFIIANLRPYDLATAENESVRYSTISILIFGLVFYILFFSLLVFLGRTTEVTIHNKPVKVNVAGIFLVMSVLFAMMIDNRFHDVNLIEENAIEDPQDPPSLEQYFQGWLQERMPKIGKASESKPYPIFIVSTYGGGIRAAAWTSLAIATLDGRIKKHTEGTDDFQNHVFAYSGASGGTIGASVMCALRKENQVISTDELVSFYRNDFLSPVVIGLIGRDFFSSTFGFNFQDRAVLQEEIWEYHMNKHFGNNSYKQGISKIWDGKSYNVPLLFANTTHVESGVKGVVTAVRFSRSDFPSGVPVAAYVRQEELERRAENPEYKVRDLKLSTAAFFSARFPFISPAGRVNAGNHFLDGGIYENSGAETAAEIERILRRMIDSNEDVRGKVKIIVLSLKNSPPASTAKVDKNLFELSAPLKALVNNVDGNAMHADEVNRSEFGERYQRLFPQTTDAQSEDHKAILPLGWQLSDNALRRLQINLTPANKENEQVMNKIVGKF